MNLPSSCLTFPRFTLFIFWILLQIFPHFFHDVKAAGQNLECLMTGDVSETWVEGKDAFPSIFPSFFSNSRETWRAEVKPCLQRGAREKWNKKWNFVWLFPARAPTAG